MKITLQLDPTNQGTHSTPNQRTPVSIALEIDLEQFNPNHVIKELKKMINGQKRNIGQLKAEQEVILHTFIVTLKSLLKRDDLELPQILSILKQLWSKPSILAPQVSMELDQNYIWLKIRGKLTKVPIKDIAWITAHEKMIKFYIQNGTMVHNQTLSKFGKWIAHPDLLQVHRKYIVNFQRIEKVDLKHNILWVDLDGDLNEIPISDTFKPALLKKMQRPMTY